MAATEVKLNELETSHHEVTKGSQAQLAEAVAGEQQEKITTREALRRNPKAVMWSILVSLLLVMEAYDLALVAGLMGQQAFQDYFGELQPDGSREIPANWQSACQFGAQIGSIIGILGCGEVLPRIGFKKTMLSCLTVMTGFIFIVFFAQSLPMLFVGELLCGIPWGAFNVIAQSYASEIAPLKLRGALTMYNQMCWCTGQFINAGVLYAFRERSDQWAFRIPFGLQLAWPLPLLIILSFAPESPWWLVKQGRYQEAERVVAYLEGETEHAREPHQVVAMIERTIEIEKAVSDGTTFLDIFRKTDLRRTLIATGIFVGQLVSGLYIGNYAVYFFRASGMASSATFGVGLGLNAVQWVAVLASFWLGNYVGRRRTYLWGTGFQCCMLLAVGVIASVPQQGFSLWLMCGFIVAHFGCFGLTVGPFTYTIVAEMSSMQLRAKTIAFARAAHYVGAVGFGFINTYSVNVTAWNLQGRSAYIWLGSGLLVWVGSHFWLPETKDRTYRELDILFHRKTPARDFKSTSVNDLTDH